VVALAATGIPCGWKVRQTKSKYGSPYNPESKSSDTGLVEHAARVSERGLGNCVILFMADKSECHCGLKYMSLVYSQFEHNSISGQVEYQQPQCEPCKEQLVSEQANQDTKNKCSPG
jgi:hypothetical protein